MSNFLIERIVTGELRQNCYLVKFPSDLAILIDPGSDEDIIAKRLTGFKLKFIINTHAHFDHIGAIKSLQEKFSVPFALHKDDFVLLRQANIYKVLFKSARVILIPQVQSDLSNPSDQILQQIQKLGFFILETPGHTPGSVCICIDNCLFSGDTLLPEGPGTTRLPGGDRLKLKNSIESLRKLPQNTLVYPGHGLSFYLSDFWKKIDDK